MGKSAVLKDQLNRLVGYVRFVPAGVMLRAPLEAAAQLGLLFSDGSSRIYPLSAGDCEQQIRCDPGGVVGCCVFRKEELLLFTDEAARLAFAGLLGRKKRKEPEKGELLHDERPDVRTISAEKQHVFAQPRWPPPPCMNAARYLTGGWQEE